MAGARDNPGAGRPCSDELQFGDWAVGGARDPVEKTTQSSRHCCKHQDGWMVSEGDNQMMVMVRMVIVMMRRYAAGDGGGDGDGGGGDGGGDGDGDGDYMVMKMKATRTRRKGCRERQS